MTIKEGIKKYYWQQVLSIVSHKVEIIKALEKETRKMERSNKKIEPGDVLHYSFLKNAI